MPVLFFSKEEVEKLVTDQVNKERKEIARYMAHSLSIGATWSKNIEMQDKSNPYIFTI